MKKHNPLLEVKPISSYPKNLVQSIHMISFDPNKNAELFGSYLYRVQRSPGDIDLFSEYIGKGTPSEIVEHFIKRLREMILTIREEPLHWFSEFKAGIDDRFDFPVGELVNGKWVGMPDIHAISDELFRNGLLDSEEHDKVNDTLISNKSDGDKYDIIFNLFRNKRILRWTESEILMEFKESYGRVFKLYDSLFAHSPVKIDVIIYNDNKFIELTNFIALVSDENHKKDYININLKKLNKPGTELPIEVEKLYFSNYHYSPFKSCKRIYSYARQLHKTKLINKIVPIISGDISLLYMLRTQIEILILLLNRAPVDEIPEQMIRNEIDNMKNQLAYVLFIPEEELIESHKIMNVIVYQDNITTTKVLDVLESLSELWKNYMNYETIIQMKKAGLNPPPRDILPKHMTYKYFTRQPSDNPDIK